MKIYKIISGIVLTLSSVVYAQQDPQYSQYMYNMSAVNPAYVTNQSSLISTGALYRRQWTSITGAPITANVFGNIPLNEKIELSVNYINDKIGDAIQISNNYANVDFAYITKLSPTLKLSYGLKVGVNNFNLNAAASDVSTDPAFADNPSKTEMIVGAGIFLFKSNFYAGISVPNLLPSSISADDVGVFKANTHLYMVSGYVFNLIDQVRLKPSVVIKQPIGAPLTFDVSLNSLFYDKFEIGMSYRYTDAFIALAGFNITQNLKIGYAYDFGLGEIGNFNNGSHEVIVLFNLDLLNFSNSYTSPRFY